jgi:adenosylcobinamide-phosphate synthase
MMRGSGLAALAIDLLVGEPPATLHPTVGMGAWITRGRALRRSTNPRASLVEGATVVAGGAALTGAIAHGVGRALRGLPGPIRLAATGVALKPAISLRALLDAAADVERALRGGHLQKARELLSWHLVSRDTTSLDASGVAAAAIESVAENFNDGLVAPLLANRVAGLGGAYLFRFVNTADAMLGYRTRELEWFGKAAARLDDALAFVPARCSAVLIACAALLTGDFAKGALAVMLDDADLTASPNAGWPMAAMAGALSVRLEKHGHYRLNAPARAPRARDIRRARRIVLVASILATLATDFA